MLQKFNFFIQRWMAVLTPLSLVLGVLLEDVGKHLLFLVPWLFAFMTFSSSLSMKLNDIKVFTKYHKIILVSIAFLHILMPIWAYFLSIIIFDDHLLTIGFVISVAVPTGVTSVIWVKMCKGHVPLSLSIVLIDTLLSPLIMPFLLQIIVGESITIDTTSLIFDLLWMIVLPSIAGVILNEVSKGSIQINLGKYLAPLSKLSLFGVVMINSSAVAPYLKDISWELIGVIFVVFSLSISGYIFAMLLGRFIWKDSSILTSFVFIGGMRNIAVGVIVATTYFPSKVAMPVVFGMLFQQVLAAIFSKVIQKPIRNFQ
ncbi:bile acid:sodium symporter family protein [Psychrobacillus sp. OK032]|uniref:bile acid:sodium symporter family protein n=1 Tax=Psychrobacillus sp. OK032 TaxID=1884358 RepID=UPI0008D52C43|nr:bile acid:sodium symporter family protein [Psychrobacillus sp. OK032]SER79191.1 Predicted Na+-dependent transporter [Psychrobacillus sp. OK032]